MAQDINVNITNGVTEVNGVVPDINGVITIYTGDIPQSVNGNFVSDAQLSLISNDLSGINTGDQTLQTVTDLGNTTDKDIQFADGVGVLLNNTSRLREGTRDSGAGGGIAQVCAVGYELKWEAGSQYVMDGNGWLIREVNHKFTSIPDANNDDSQGFYVGSRWILDDGSLYICTDSTFANAVWELQSIGNQTLQQVTDNGDTTTNSIYVPKLYLNDEVNDNYGSMHYTDGNFHIEDADGHKLFVVEDGFVQLHLTDAIQSNLFLTDLTETRNHTLPNQSGTIALTTDIPTIDANPTDGSSNTVSSNGVFDALADKVDKVAGSRLLTSAESTLLGNTSGTNTGDQNLSGLAPLASPTFTGTVVLPTDTSIGTVSSTELGYLDGVASSVQNQLNAKVNLNTLITPASGNKVSVDAKGLVLTITDEYATATTGSAISFATPQVWNTFSSPSTANLTDDLTGAKIGAIQKIYSNKAVAPTVPAGWVLIGTGTYTTSTLNIIFAEWVSGTRVEYWVVKPA